MAFSTFLFHEKYIILAVETWMERGGIQRGGPFGSSHSESLY